VVLGIVGVPVYFLVHPFLLLLSESVKLNWLIFLPMGPTHHVQFWSVDFNHPSLMLADGASVVSILEGVFPFLEVSGGVLRFVVIVCLVS